MPPTLVRSDRPSQPGLQAAAFTVRARSWLAFQALSRRDLPIIFCKPAQHPAGTQPVLLHADYSFKILGGIPGLARKQHAFINKIPGWLLSFVYIFLTAYLLYVQDYILIFRMMHFKRHCCQLQYCLSRFSHSIPIKGEKLPKYKVGGGKKKEKKRRNDFWTYLLVTLHFQMLIFPALWQKQKTSVLVPFSTWKYLLSALPLFLLNDDTCMA